MHDARSRRRAAAANGVRRPRRRFTLRRPAAPPRRSPADDTAEARVTLRAIDSTAMCGRRQRRAARGVAATERKAAVRRERRAARAHHSNRRNDRAGSAALAGQWCHTNGGRPASSARRGGLVPAESESVGLRLPRDSHTPAPSCVWLQKGELDREQPAIHVDRRQPRARPVPRAPAVAAPPAKVRRRRVHAGCARAVVAASPDSSASLRAAPAAAPPPRPRAVR